MKLIELSSDGVSSIITDITASEGFDVLTNAALLAIHNTATGKTTKKFATRAKALSQTWAAVQGYTEIDVRPFPPSPPVLHRGTEADTTHPSAPAPVPSSSAPSKGRGRPTSREFNCEKQADGNYFFTMNPRVAKMTPGGRRPELIELLRKRPTFSVLVKQFNPAGESDDKKAFNMATTVTMLGTMCGYGVATGPDGRLTLSEPLS